MFPSSLSLFLLLILGCILITTNNAFVIQQPNHCTPSTTTSLRMGIFDSISKAFANEEYGPPPDKVKATARHILVPTLDDIEMIQDKLRQQQQQSPETFSVLAQQYSTCPSGRQSGGSLGTFSPGTMVAEFDKVVFSPETTIGQVMGPIQTEFGYHLIVVEKRSGGGDWY